MTHVIDIFGVCLLLLPSIAYTTFRLAPQNVRLWMLDRRLAFVRAIPAPLLPALVRQRWTLRLEASRDRACGGCGSCASNSAKTSAAKGAASASAPREIRLPAISISRRSK